MSPSEKNTEKAFHRSWELGFGTETDLNYLNGEIVISHDLPIVGNLQLSFDYFLSIYSKYRMLPLALNIKTNGIQNLVRASLDKFEVENYVLFDMSVPDQIATIKKNLKHLTRSSEYESAILLDAAEGVWADEFNDDWIDIDFLTNLTSKNKTVYIVSPELHNRNHLPRWKEYKSMGVHNYHNIYLCTDYPEQAREFFEV